MPRARLLILAVALALAGATSACSDTDQAQNPQPSWTRSGVAGETFSPSTSATPLTGITSPNLGGVGH